MLITILNKFFQIFIGLLLSPIILLSCLIIIIVEKKNPIFIQERVGLNRKIFKIIKLRTMIDNKVTKLGYYMRKCRLDEFPQIINVIKGDMNFIGPRPIIKSEYEIDPSVFSKEESNKNFVFLPIESEKLYDRVKVLPGITGWAQINGPLKNQIIRLEYDMYYIKNKSFLLDLSIILYTIRTFLTGKRLGDYSKQKPSNISNLKPNDITIL